MVMLTSTQIRELRLAMGYKAPDFAELFGVCEDTVWRWERDQTHPTYKKMVKLAELWADAVERGLFKKVMA